MGARTSARFTPLSLRARFRAILIDACCILGVQALALIAVSWPTVTRLSQFRLHPEQAIEHALRGSIAFWGLAAYLVLLGLAYQVFFVAFGGATPGLRAVHGQIIDAYGHVPSVTRALARAGGVVLTLVSAGLGWGIARLDKKRRSVADWCAATYVIARNGPVLKDQVSLYDGP